MKCTSKEKQVGTPERGSKAQVGLLVLKKGLSRFSHTRSLAIGWMRGWFSDRGIALQGPIGCQANRMGYDLTRLHGSRPWAGSGSEADHGKAKGP
ncbi:hypothetical protein DY000_02040193 [Brassica cretica]|uniref:Uncharacterized protein n=1 Tax=Brassica cretica TaxID=69181 RepID=A0ABQ7B513_BRACR|nr:hypothetical protein DY000_02040193 [Brassica cretica]